MENELKLKDVIHRLQTTPGFDVYAINHLIEDTGANTVLRILARFSVSLEESLPGFDKGGTESQTSVWKSAHKLAGSAEMLGFKDFGQKSKHLSSVLKNSDNPNTHVGEISAYKNEVTDLIGTISKSFPERQNFL
ncbi:MAG: Hpt domain-containing protein [Bdellovibrio sp.]|nr:Hpt domain-containing protein [Bdellovibrio sp.]